MKLVDKKTGDILFSGPLVQCEQCLEYYISHGHHAYLFEEIKKELQEVFYKRLRE